ncbi:MAG: DUF1905 domain-containing protein [Deltaproteobacteria bacterium]|nr:DUF1905 domain-containing protein [Deltaproteobacteria bacterium]
MAPSPEDPTVRFRAELLRDRMFYYVQIPEKVTKRLEPFARSGRVSVKGTVGGEAYLGTFLPAGKGRQVLVLNADVRRRAALTVGEAVSLQLAPCAPDLVLVPEDLAARLKAAGLRKTFDALAPSHRKAYLRYLDTAKSPVTRARYLDRVLSRLKGEEPEKRASTSGRKAGWRCPACARWFLREDAPHPCDPVPLSVPFEKRGPEVFALFERVKALLETHGKVTVQVGRDSVALAGRRRLLDVLPRRAWLDLGFWLPRRLEHPRFRRVVTVGMSLHVHFVRVTHESDLDEELRAWLAEAWAHGAPPPDEVASTGWNRPVEDSFFEGLEAL